MFSSKYEAQVILDKPCYSPGEQVNGILNLIVHSQSNISTIDLCFRGEEFVNIVKMESESYERFNSETNQTETATR